MCEYSKACLQLPPLRQKTLGHFRQVLFLKTEDPISKYLSPQRNKINEAIQIKMLSMALALQICHYHILKGYIGNVKFYGWLI